MNKHHHHHKCSCQTTDTTIVPDIFIISYLDTICLSDKHGFLKKIQGTVIDIIGPTRDLVEIDNDDWRHLEPSAIGDLIESMSGHRVIAYPDRFLTINDPLSVPMHSPLCTSNSVFDFCNINANAFPADPPNDPFFIQERQWYLTSTRVNEVWRDYKLTGSGITVAVIDSGIDTNQEDLRTNILPGHNVINNGDNTSDSDGHGTQVSGIIAATTNNGIGIASVSPHAKVRPIKVFKKSPFDFSSVLTGFEYIIKQLKKDKNYVQIINCSVGALIGDIDFEKVSTDFKNILNQLNDYEVLVVFSAGNEGNKLNEPLFPAILADPKHSNLSNIITVGGIDEDNRPVPSSSHGSNYVQVAAPGIDILTTNITTYYFFNNNYASVTGTSFATPIVSGILALMYQLINNIPTTENKADYIRRKLFEGTVKTPETGSEPNKYWKYGVVDAINAITLIQVNPPKLII